VKLGLLLVLDLTPKPNGIIIEKDSIKVEIIEKENDPIKKSSSCYDCTWHEKRPSNVKNI
jgi:hypothetical protein